MSSNDHYIVDYQKFGGIKLYKVHGFMGDYIELDNSVVERKVCSLEEAENINSMKKNREGKLSLMRFHGSKKE